jgi:hypothetical protein
LDLTFGLRIRGSRVANVKSTPRSSKIRTLFIDFANSGRWIKQPGRSIKQSRHPSSFGAMRDRQRPGRSGRRVKRRERTIIQIGARARNITEHEATALEIETGSLEHHDNT